MARAVPPRDRLVTNGEYLAFIEDGGYRRPDFWLSDGWATVQNQGWEAPLYWQRGEAVVAVFSLSGLRRLDPAARSAMCFYEADAYAQWAGKRLPTEAEWEAAERLAGFAERPTSPGNGRAAPIAPIPASRLGRAPSASTMASS